MGEKFDNLKEEYLQSAAPKEDDGSRLVDYEFWEWVEDLLDELSRLERRMNEMELELSEMPEEDSREFNFKNISYNREDGSIDLMISLHLPSEEE